MSNAVDFDAISLTLYDWINSRGLVNKDRIFLEDPNADRPPTPSISYRFLTGLVKLGTSDTHIAGVSTDTVTGMRHVTVSFKGYGKGSLQFMNNLHASEELFEVQQIFQKGNIAVASITSVIDVSQTLETGIEERYSLDIIFGVTSNQVVDDGAIEHVEITDSTYVDVDGTVKQTINTTIDKP